MLQDILITGLINSGVYALLAVGFSLIFGVARIVNITHTAFYMVAAYLVYVLGHLWGWPAWLAIVAAVIAVTILGLLSYRLVIEPVREHETAVLISTIALAAIFQELMIIGFGGHYLSIPSLIDGYTQLAGVRMTNQQLLTLVIVAVTLVGVWLLLAKTRLGLAIRATAEDREVANLMGMNVRHVALWTMGISVGLAAIAGVVVAPLFVVDPLMWLDPLITVLAIVVLGGLGSLKGSVIGALIIGYVETSTVFLLPAGSFLKSAVALSIMVLVLVVRPEGLFGIAFEEER